MKYHFKKEKKVQNHVCMFGVVESFRIGCKTDGRSFGASRAARYVCRAVSSAVNPNRFQDGRAIFRRKSDGALCVSRRVVGREPVQAKSARFVPTDRPSVKKIRAVNDERTAQAKSARLVPKDCPSVKREKKNCFDAWV